MLRNPIYLAILLFLAIAAPSGAQTSPSLGDLARQARSEKSTTQSAKVITNDDIPSAAPIGDFPLAEPSAATSPVTAPPNGSATPNLAQVRTALDRMDSLLTSVNSLDRQTLVKNVLQGNDVNFPGRGAWEQRLLTARETYVTRGRELMQNARQLVGSAEALEAAHATANDPRVLALNTKLQQFVQDCVRTGSAFQAVALEGKDLAHQGSGQ